MYFCKVIAEKIRLNFAWTFPKPIINDIDSAPVHSFLHAYKFASKGGFFSEGTDAFVISSNRHCDILKVSNHVK